jgi:subtilisin family serine protease
LKDKNKNPKNKILIWNLIYRTYMERKMKVSRNIVLFLIILLVSVSLTEGIGASFNYIVEEEEKEPKWWENWKRDTNYNKIDDLIEALPQKETFGIFINYDQHPQDKDISRLSRFQINVKFVYKYIDVICARDVDFSEAKAISKLPHVIMVKLEPEIVPTLDISARAIKARDSDNFSPNTAFDLGFTGAGVTIAILDSGVDDWGRNPSTRHESLDDLDDNPATSDQKWKAGVDFTQDESILAPRDGSHNPDDVDGHGTHVAGTALGTGGTSEYIGVAPQARLVDVKVIENFGTTSAGNSIAGIEWCIEHKSSYGIRILSLSYGSVFGESDGSDEESRTVNHAFDAGLVVIAAIGNDGKKRVTSPAAADGAIAVGSMDDHDTIDRNDDTLSSFSNSGPRLDDGDDDKMDELKPDVVAYGDGIWAALANTQAGYTSKSGTSMSTPHVTGVVALMLEANPSLSPQQVKEILRESAQTKGTPSFPSLDPKYNADYGWGIVDAYKAIEMARGFVEVGISLDSPVQDAAVRGTITISGTAYIVSGSGSISSVEVGIDDPTFEKFVYTAEGTSTWTVEWDTTTWNGVRTIYARAVSGEYSARTSVIVAVVNDDDSGGTGGIPTDDGPPEIDLGFGKISVYAAAAGIAIIAGIILAIVAAIVLKRKKMLRRMMEERKTERIMR